MSDTNLTAWCVKCKAMRPVEDAVPVFMANGRPATRGRCGVCGTGLNKIGDTEAHAGMPRPEVRAAAPKPRKQAAGKAKGAATVKAKPVAAGAKGTSRTKAPEPAPAARGRGGKGASRLVIVESPAKARTVGRFLGGDYEVRASVGHVRDLLRSRLSVDVEQDFAPTYRVPNEKKDVVKQIREAASRAREIYLATDPDREGEAIAWHLLEAAEIPTDRTRRVVFHEITRSAIADAFAHSREVDMRLVDAQQARRILDRLVGYQVSPLLWTRVRSRLSAGRVQSVALRLIVEREREILAFVPVEYWSIDADLAQVITRRQAPRPSFLARLVRIRGAEADLKNRDDAAQVVRDLEGAEYRVAGVKRGERRRRPSPPFTTSTLQQDAAQRLGMTAQRTMRVAQDLYEGIVVGDEGSVGLITYMRTDSVNVALEAQAEARALVREQYGAEYVPAEPNVFKSRAKNAQEAHEAIRPTSAFRRPEAIRSFLNKEQNRLYELIWQRFVASQMAAAIYDTMTVDVDAGAPAAAVRPYLFRATGSSVRFPGFLVVYSGSSSWTPTGPDGADAAASANGNGRNGRGAVRDDEAVAENGQERLAPAPERELPQTIAEGEILDLLRLLPEQHFTQPPPRYTEATLVKALEENGIGRPSTYATIISTILDRGYTERSERKLVPTELGFTVNDLLVKHFDPIFNVAFTADMEERLDAIANGEQELVRVLHAFYDSFAPQLREAEASMVKVVVEPERIGEACPECGGELVIKQGRFGKFVGCSNYPTCRYTRPIVQRTGAACPVDGGEIVERRTKRGRVFYGCANYPKCDFTSWKRPLPEPCARCGGLMVVASRDTAECIRCDNKIRIGAQETRQAVK